MCAATISFSKYKFVSSNTIIQQYRELIIDRVQKVIQPVEESLKIFYQKMSHMDLIVPSN